jgi:hypothetical protein
MTGPRSGAPPGNDAGPDPAMGTEAGVDEQQRAASSRSVSTTVAELADQKTVRGGRVARFTLRRTDAGGCQDCGQAWTGPLAFLWATEHTLQTGHTTAVGRTVVYRYRPAGGAR